MHRIDRLNELVKQWKELELDETCVKADNITRMLIKYDKVADEISILNRRSGKVEIIIGFFNADVAYTTGYLEKDQHTKITLAIWALETAVENY